MATNFYRWLEVLFGGNLSELQSTQDELHALYQQRAERSDTDDKATKRVRALAIAELERRMEGSQTAFGRSLWNVYAFDKQQERSASADDERTTEREP